jgi:SH3-like domain-containing protein
MNRMLLSLWLMGAVLYGANTLIITGWPSSHKQITDRAENGGVTPKTVANAQGEHPDTASDAKAQTAENTALQAAPSPDASPQAAPSSQGSDAQSASAPVPAPAQQPAPSGAQPQQDQSGSAAPDQSQPQTQAQDQPEAPSQGTQGMLPPQPQQQGVEVVKVASQGADVRAGPSSSAPQLAMLPPGMTLRVVSRQRGWVEVANGDGSQTGWINENLLEINGTPGEQLPAMGNSAAAPGVGQQQSQGELVKVSGSTGTMRSGPSEDAPVLFAFPEGRVFRVVSRKPGWVEIMDMSSKQTGWMAESSIAPAHSSLQPSMGMPQRHEEAEGEGAVPEGSWVPPGEYIGPPQEMDEGDQAPRHWGHRRHGGFAGILRRALGG